LPWLLAARKLKTPLPPLLRYRRCRPLKRLLPLLLHLPLTQHLLLLLLLLHLPLTLHLPLLLLNLLQQLLAHPHPSNRDYLKRAGPRVGSFFALEALRGA